MPSGSVPKRSWLPSFPPCACARLRLRKCLRTQGRKRRRAHVSEAYFQAITTHASDIVFVVDREGVITYANHAVERHLGYKPEELTGRCSLDLIAPVDLHRAVQDFSMALTSTADTISNAFRVKHKDGSERFLEGIGINLFDNPAVGGFVMNVRDATERLKAEEALQASESKYRRLHQSMRDAFVSVDMEGYIRDCNESYLRMLGYTQEEIVTLTSRDLTRRNGMR